MNFVRSYTFNYWFTHTGDKGKSDKAGKFLKNVGNSAFCKGGSGSYFNRIGHAFSIYNRKSRSFQVDTVYVPGEVGSILGTGFKGGTVGYIYPYGFGYIGDCSTGISTGAIVYNCLQSICTKADTIVSNGVVGGQSGYIEGT